MFISIPIPIIIAPQAGITVTFGTILQLSTSDSEEGDAVCQVSKGNTNQGIRG